MPRFTPVTHALPVLLYIAAIAACNESPAGVQGDPPADTSGPPIDEVELIGVASGLSSPVHLTAPVGDSRLFIVEKVGRVRIVSGGQLLNTPFLDVSSLVSNGGEQGLLSMAFHPDYASNGYFYIYYTDNNGDTRVARYSVSAGNANVADPTSDKVIFALPQPYGNHNGGLIAFGTDGMLYIGLGDGGGGGDPDGHGQNLGTLLGSLLRIDVDSGDPYGIPADNPFVGNAAALDEIWAYGLRNPWRYSFDAEQGAIYIADVGQNDWEEINVESDMVGGVNYGWNVMEGASCFNAASCNQSGLHIPVLEYANGSEGCAVVGGFVYRGDAINGLGGTYFYSDNCAGWIRSFDLEFGQAARLSQWDLGNIGNVLSFGEDGEGELYVLSANGNVYKFVADR
ncbi:MAG: PQQ-dependent sugar dehydrogenase [Gemmatimonadota bacterium]|nr:MAG: PQQ-dependent sugar dehydrogenase [Gemmatimonadota bacterium]